MARVYVAFLPPRQPVKRLGDASSACGEWTQVSVCSAMANMLCSRLELFEKGARSDSMALGQLECVFCRAVTFKYEVDDEDLPAYIKAALVDACDQIEEDLMPRVDEKSELPRATRKRQREHSFAIDE